MLLRILLRTVASLALVLALGGFLSHTASPSAVNGKKTTLTS
ncbi:MAG TPA: hypothetical protein VFZ00_25760 [Solirubrobacter sp.]|nr:hypothetical protein [Solirubrobacter sp.]